MSPGHSASTAREALGLVDVAPLHGQGREVAAGDVPVDALVNAGEFLGAAQRKDPPPGSLGLGRLVAAAVSDGLAEPELGVFGIDGKPVGTRPQGGAGIAQRLVGACDQGEQLAGDRIRRG